MLYLIGLGLGDAKDITVKGLEVVQQCSRVYLEAYTSILTVGKEALVGNKSWKEFCFKTLKNKFRLRSLPQYYKIIILDNMDGDLDLDKKTWFKSQSAIKLTAWVSQ